MSYLGRALEQEMTLVKDLAKQLTVAASKLNGAMMTSTALDDRVLEQNERFNHAIDVFKYNEACFVLLVVTQDMNCRLLLLRLLLLLPLVCWRLANNESVHYSHLLVWRIKWPLFPYDLTFL